LAAGQLPLAVDTGLSAADAAAVAGWDADAAVLLAEVAAQRRSRSVVELPRSLSASQLVRLHADPNGLARELARPMPRRPAPAIPHAGTSTSPSSSRPSSGASCCTTRRAKSTTT